MNEPEPELKFSQQHSLDLMEAQLQHQNSTFDTLDQKAQQVINISGIVVALVAGFGAIQNSNSENAKILVLGLLLSSAVGIGLAIKALWLKSWKNVVKIEDEDFYDKTLKPLTEGVYFEQMMSRYLETILSHKQVLKRKTWYTQTSLICAVIGLIITGLILLNQISSTPLPTKP